MKLTNEQRQRLLDVWAAYTAQPSGAALQAAVERIIGRDLRMHERFPNHARSPHLALFQFASNTTQSAEHLVELVAAWE